MASFFSKAANVFGFASSQINASNMNSAGAMESPFRSSQSNVNTKVQSAKKRKSLDENGGSGKKKRKKDRRSSNYEEEFQGFGDTDADAGVQDNPPSSLVEVNGVNGGEDVQDSNNTPQNATKKHKGKEQKTPEKGRLESGINGNSSPELLRDTNGLAIQDGNAVQPPSSKKARKKERKKLRRSLEAARQHDMAMQEAKQSAHKDPDSPATPGPLLFNGVTTETLTESKKLKKSKKKKKKQRSSSFSAVDNTDVQAQDVEVQTDIVASSPTPVARSKKKSKKRRRSSLALEADIPVEPIVDKPEEGHDVHAETMDPVEDGDSQGDFTQSTPAVTPKQKPKHSKAALVEDQEIDTHNKDLLEASQEHEAQSRKSKKSREHKKKRKSSDGGASVDVLDPLNDAAAPEASRHDNVEATILLSNPSEPVQGDENHLNEQVNGTQHTHRFPELGQDVDLTASNPKGEKLKRSKKKATSSTAIGQAEADTPIASLSVDPEIQKPSEPEARKPESSDRAASPILGQAFTGENVANSSKLKKSKNRTREKAFKESFGRAEDDLASNLGNPLSAPSPSWQAINKEPVKSSPSQTIGIYDANGSRITNLSKSKSLSTGDKHIEKASKISVVITPDSSADSDLDAQVTAKTPTAGSKRKRTARTDDSDVNPEALRLPTKKRRTHKPAIQSGEEREVNPEALRLPEKKKSKKSAATPKKRADSATGTSSSGGTAKLKGPFTDEEAQTMQSVLERYGSMHDLTDHAVREILHANARSSAKSAALLKELYEALPNRPPEAIAKVARRKFHNYPRYGKWTTEEDEELKDAFRRHKNSWVKVAADLDRHPEDVRDRWRNHVVCGEKLENGPWTKEEEEDMMIKIETRLASLRDAMSPEKYEAELKKGRTEYEMLDWGLISNDMGRKRSRLQCQSKYKQLIDRQAPAPAGASQDDPETKSWRTKKGRAEVTFMKPGDKYMLLSGIQRAGYGREEKVVFRRIGDEAFQKNFTNKAKKLALKFMRREIPGQKQMTLQQVVTKAIENLETEFPDRLTERYNPEADGAYPTRRTRKPSSRRNVTASDDEESDDSSSSEDSEDDHDPKKTPKLRNRMRRHDETEEKDDVQKPRRAKPKSRATVIEDSDDDEIDVDRVDDVDMPDAEAEEGSQSGSRSRSSERELEIEDSDEGFKEPSSHRSSRHVYEQDSDEEDGKDDQNNAESPDLGTSHALANENKNSGESLDNEEENVSIHEVEDQGSEENDSNERQRRASSVSSLGREFRLGGGNGNLEDVEISSDDSFEDIPAVRPPTLARPSKTPSRRDRSMLRRRLK